MARIRVTTQLLEHLLDLPVGVGLTDVIEIKEVDGDGSKVQVVVFEIMGESEELDGWAEVEYALQYEETQHGTSLVSAIPVPA